MLYNVALRKGWIYDRLWYNKRLKVTNKNSNKGARSTAAKTRIATDDVIVVQDAGRGLAIDNAEIIADNVAINATVEATIIGIAETPAAPELQGAVEMLQRNDKEDEIVALAKFFEKCVLPADRTLLLNHLRKTADLRKENILHDKYLFNKSRHLYIVSPELVLIGKN